MKSMVELYNELSVCYRELDCQNMGYTVYVQYIGMKIDDIACPFPPGSHDERFWKIGFNSAKNDLAGVLSDSEESGE